MRSSEVEIITGDALATLREFPAASFDAVITDPPYPCIKREYGYWTEAEWFALMNPVVEECRRVLKPTGSAVFILQPNSERVGRMRTWLWEFMAKWGKEWGMVQDAWWWNHATLPTAIASHGKLMRATVKACVWLGQSGCYRDQDSVLWTESDQNKAYRLSGRCERHTGPGAGTRVQKRDRIAAASAKRGGVTPFNLLPISNANSTSSAGAHGHGAGTPLALCRWWVRYICPPGGRVLDPFVGSGTTLLAAMKEGREGVGIERHPPYADIARRRIAEAQGPIFAEVS